MLQSVTREELSAICRGISRWGFCEGAIADELGSPHHRVSICWMIGDEERFETFKKTYHTPVNRMLVPFKIIKFGNPDRPLYSIYPMNREEYELVHDLCACERCSG